MLGLAACRLALEMPRHRAPRVPSLLTPSCSTPGTGPSPGSGSLVLNFTEDLPNTRTSHGKSGRSHRHEQPRGER